MYVATTLVVGYMQQAAARLPSKVHANMSQLASAICFCQLAHLVFEVVLAAQN